MKSKTTQVRFRTPLSAIYTPIIVESWRQLGPPSCQSSVGRCTAALGSSRRSAWSRQSTASSPIKSNAAWHQTTLKGGDWIFAAHPTRVDDATLRGACILRGQWIHVAGAMWLRALFRSRLLILSEGTSAQRRELFSIADASKLIRDADPCCANAQGVAKRSPNGG
jgi:hypothetical protein